MACTLLLASCASPAAIDGGGLDAGVDATARDSSSLDAATRCASDPDCAAGERCFAGACQPDPCAAASPCDEATAHCVATCVQLGDPCEGVTCDADETCLDGECFPGCLPAPCAGRVCPAGRFCDENGTCRVIDPCRAECGSGAACHFTCVPRTACEGVTCGEGELCRDGVCVANPCSGVECARGEVCVNGSCTATCDCDPPCAPAERCVANRCVCSPRCAADAACGDDDGCGGFCPGACPGARDGCDIATGTCVCTPRCADDAACGDDDGCGGRCDGWCTDRRTCIAGECVCTDICAPADRIACGAPIGDTCAGSACPGTGTMCAAGSDCVDGRCCPACATAFSIDCGDPIPDATDSTGASCRTCSGLGVRCSMGRTCVAGSVPDTRVCCGLCADPASVPCGTALDDVRDDTGAICRRCSLAYGTACPVGQSCTGGPSGVCCETCAPPESIDCGAPIPDPACRVCSGVGSRCPTGTSCVSPPGAGPDEHECCASCPSADTVACGAPIAPVLGADGEVCRTCGAGTMCPSGQVCADATCCTPSCAPASTRPCGSTPSDGCGGTCEPGTQCALPAAVCTGDPLACECTPLCAGRRCGETDGCGGECVGACEVGFVCTERPPPSAPGDYACEPSDCVASCGLCESCILGSCEPLACATGESVCLVTCECCTAGQVCTPRGCDDFG